jgi:2-oxoglutarate dehydrogenase E2 component (dihydrolipoamide succinyltransferase)
MKVDVKMPKLGESLTEGTILKWWKKPGDEVKKDETILEVSTDKVDSEIPSPVDGILLEIIAQEQETVEIDAVLARVDTKTDEGQLEKVVTPENEKDAVSQKNLEASETASNLADVIMPKLGESLTEGTILKWWKKPGDEVKKDETLLEVSTDKVDSEIPSPVDGILKEILFNETETVEVDQVIARVAISESVNETKPLEKEEKKVEKEKKPVAKDEFVQQKEIKSGRKKLNRFYSPLVLNIARKEGISFEELDSIVGSGKSERVTKKDMMTYIGNRTSPKSAPTTSGISYKKGRTEVIPMDHIRKQIAHHMRQSLDTSAHVYSVSECDMTKVMNLMHANREQFLKQEGFKLTVTPFVLYAVVKALQDFPRVNSSLDGDNIIEREDVNLGIAVATAKGLIVPVVKNAEEKSFTGLARSVQQLVQKARDNKLTYEEIEGSTFSVTNYGIFGNIIGLPIINQPNVAILGLGVIKKRPVVLEYSDGDAIVIRSMTYISMSYDHRLVDGELGGKFMQRVVEYLEDFNEDIL